MIGFPFFGLYVPNVAVAKQLYDSWGTAVVAGWSTLIKNEMAQQERNEVQQKKKNELLKNKNISVKAFLTLSRA